MHLVSGAVGQSGTRLPRQHEAKAEGAREVERMKLVHMPDPDDTIF
jgi:hypothetical protein